MDKCPNICPYIARGLVGQHLVREVSFQPQTTSENLENTGQREEGRRRRKRKRRKRRRRRRKRRRRRRKRRRRKRK